jgi:hypothetical protein
MNETDIEALINFLELKNVNPELHIHAAKTVLKIHLNAMKQPSGLLVQEIYTEEE